MQSSHVQTTPRKNGIDLETATKRAGAEDIYLFKLGWFSRRLPPEVISQACRGEIPFELLSTRSWGRKLCEYLFSIRDRDQKIRAEKQAMFLAFVDHINSHAHKLLLGRDKAQGGRSSVLWVDKLLRILHHRDRWIRPIEEWRPPPKTGKSVLYRTLINHLFVPYKKGTQEHFRLPENAYFYWDWDWRPGRPYWTQELEKARFFHLAAGKDLRSLPGLSVRLTRRQAHLVMNTPEPLPLKIAIIHACVRDLGGNRALAEEFAKVWWLKNLITITDDPEKRERRAREFAFWVTVMRFFVQHRELGPDRVREVCDYIKHVKFDCEVQRDAAGNILYDSEGEPLRAAPQPDFSMKGRSPRALLRRIALWHEELGRKRDDEKLIFSGSKLPSFRLPVEEKPGWFWRVRELLSSQDLAIEGQKMHHCVYSYADRAAQGACHIFTLEEYRRVEDGWDEVIKHLTIEVTPKREIVQIRGKYNARPTREERAVLKEWARKLSLEIRD